LNVGRLKGVAVWVGHPAAGQGFGDGLTRTDIQYDR
jgi:hypothetical protein